MKSPLNMGIVPPSIKTKGGFYGALAGAFLALGTATAAHAIEVSVSFRDAGIGGFGGSQLQNIDSPDSMLGLPGISNVEFVQDTASGRFEAIQVGCDSQGNDVAVTLRMTADPSLINGVDGGGYLSFLACVNWLDQPGGTIEGFGFMQPIGGSFTIDYIDPATPDVQIARPAKTSGNNLFVDLTVSGGSVTYVFDGTPAASFIGSANFKPPALVDALNSYLQEVNPPSDPAIEGVKTSAISNDTGAAGLSAGDEITYSFAITNTGNVSLSNVHVASDTLSRADSTELTGAITSFTLGAGQSTSLAPGESTSYSATYTVSQADIDAGGLSNTATVQGTHAGGDVSDVTDDGNDSDGNTADDPTEMLVVRDPLIRVTKTVDDSALEDGVRAGDTLYYTITVENLGNVTLSNVVLTDTLRDMSGTPLTLTDGPHKTHDSGANTADDALDIGDVWTYQASYVLTTADIATGGLENIAVVTARAPDNTTVTAESAVGGNTSDDGAGAPTGTGFPGEVSGTVRQYAQGVAGVQVFLLRETAPGSGVYDYVMNPDNPSQRLSTVTDDGGNYVFVGLPAGTYGVEFDNQGSENVPTAISEEYAEVGNRIIGIAVNAGDVEVEQDAFFVDPSGVVYDSNTFTPISGALVTLYHQATTGAARNEVPNAWLNTIVGDANRVTTGANGSYAFLLNPATAQDGVYSIEVSKSGYKFTSEAIAPRTGVFDSGIGGGLVEVTDQAVPSTGMDTTYYLAFKMEFSLNPALTSNGVINNHIPLDEDLLPLVESDLVQILEDDLAETMTQQSRQMNRFAAGALKRLKSRDRNQCLAALSDVLDQQQVLFDTAKAVLKPQSGPVLDEMAEILNTCEDAAFEIAGHTDDRASDAYNMALSQARVDAVVVALGQRGVDTTRLVGKGYGESKPIADNATDEGRAANRRVEFLPLQQAHNADECVGSDKITRSVNASATNANVTANGSFDRETRNCHDDSWRITTGTVSYLSNDSGISQGMFNLTIRTEKFATQDRVTGKFFGLYGSKSDVTGLANGEILGFGMNAGVYGAQRFASGLFVDYYLGGAVGHHAFDLDFNRAGGVVTAQGHYRYFAAFAGAAVSGQTKMGALTISPRAGVDLAWSPGGDVDVTLTHGAIEDSANLTIGKMSGARLFGEARIEDLLPGVGQTLAFTPRVFCDRPIGGTVNDCGYGAAIELSHADLENGTTFSATLDGERTGGQEYIGLVLELERALREGTLTGSSTVSSQGDISIMAQYKLEF